jgi:hypothetical protein
MFNFPALHLLAARRGNDVERTIGGTSLTPEEAELARLGYKQEFRREFSWLATFSFAFSISGLLATVLHISADQGDVDIWLSACCWRAPGYSLVLVLVGCVDLGLSVAPRVCASQ